ncbi:TraR/DksA family transcriptional regulator [Dactylosporangium sp. AC04546]|uniref:TraR/DksA family transcriptional regulator n=1 Tax=Dactylosporangium sp. AC04546 TaxID=2862460 RepID=UPI001EDCBF69|nr:TraR/DksA family transcriptional regulator [Dactylosporangium sp. AC04546]WVK87293.1 TraR/DksA family transcriptional regulator [Dactylosporangium sp. AC04546]
MNIDTGPSIDTLRQTLQAQLRQHSQDLAVLTAAGTDPGSTGEDPQTVAERTVAARHAIEEIAAALSRITDGAYGHCERCTNPIPGARLEILPHARFCVPCQARAR